MIIAVLVPEYLVGKALNDWLAARYIPHWCSQLADEIRSKVPEWEPVHGYYANLGGFVLDFTALKDVHTAPSEGVKLACVTAHKTNGKAQISGINAEYAATFLRQLIDDMLQGESKTLQPVERINLVRMRRSRWVLNLGLLYGAYSLRLIEALPSVSGKELEGLDKGDALVKSITVLQVLWLIIQLIVRKCANLESSQLEVAALAFSVSSVITYILYLGRPQGVVNVTRIEASRLPTREDVKELLKWSPSYLWIGRRSEAKAWGDLDLLPIPNDACHAWATQYVPEGILEAVNGNDESITVLLGTIIGGAVFGGVHCIAWNFSFPTMTERLLWRIASILTTTLPMVSMPFNFYWLRLHGWSSSIVKDIPVEVSQTSRFLVGTPLLALIAVYIIARLFIMVEIFRSLLYLPPEAFADTWSGSFPHWG
jgi:hypothetical protein